MFQLISIETLTFENYLFIINNKPAIYVITPPSIAASKKSYNGQLIEIIHVHLCFSRNVNQKIILLTRLFVVNLPHL